MFKILDGVVVDGFDIDNEVCQINEKGELIPSSFLSLEFGELLPVSVKGKISVCNMFTLTLNANTSYKIQGRHSGTRDKVDIHLSEAVLGKNLRDTEIAIINTETIDETGKFAFLETFNYRKTTELVVWTALKENSTELGVLEATAIALSAPANFKYKIIEIQPDPPAEGENAEEITNYGLYVNGNITFQEGLKDSIGIYLAVFKQESATPPESYQKIDFDNLIDTPKEVLTANVLRGIYELEHGLLNFQDENFETFFSSLSALSSGNTSANTEDRTLDLYNLTALWGAPESNNRAMVWASNEEGGIGEIEIIGTSWYDYNACLSGDTLITMYDGSQKPMRDIKVGDEVLAQNGEKDIVHTVKNGIFSPYHILYYFDDGTVIDEISDHRFYNKNQGFWQRLKRWKIGEVTLNQNGEEVALIGKEVIEESAENFGIFTHTGTYYANGLLSGAAHCNKNLLRNVTIEQAIDMMLSVDERKMEILLGLREGVI